MATRSREDADININKISYGIALRLSRELDPEDKWKDLLVTIHDNPLDGPPLDSDFRGILDNCHQRKESPTERLLSELGHKGYRVMHLKHWLRLAGLYRALDVLEGGDITTGIRLPQHGRSHLYDGHELSSEFEPVVKKPKFEERNIPCSLCGGDCNRWKCVHSVKTIDVPTGIAAKGRIYKSKRGAEKHAGTYLKGSFLTRGIFSLGRDPTTGARNHQVSDSQSKSFGRFNRYSGQDIPRSHSEPTNTTPTGTFFRGKPTLPTLTRPLTRKQPSIVLSEHHLTPYENTGEGDLSDGDDVGRGTIELGQSSVRTTPMSSTGPINEGRSDVDDIWQVVQPSSEWMEVPKFKVQSNQDYFEITLGSPKGLEDSISTSPMIGGDTGEGGSPIAESFQMKFIKAAIEESGYVEVEIVKCVTLGPPEAGKTQLKRALTGNMQESTDSTPLSTGAEVSMERFFDGGVTWDRLGKAELQAALYNTVDSESYNREDPVLDHPQSENRTCAPGDETTSGNISTNSDREDSGQEESVNPDLLYQEFSRLRGKVLGNFSKSKGNRKLDKVRFIHFIDSGGQPAFFDLHPVVATSRAVYLIVYNSAEGLSACPRITYRKPSDFPTKELLNPNQSNLNMIKRSLITLHHCKQKFFLMGERLQMCLGVENVSNQILPIMFVGTKKGEWLQDKSGPINKSITSCFSSYPSLRNNLRFDSYFVESLDPSCEGVKKLRKAISDPAYKFQIPFPLKWFYCQLIFWSADNPAFSVLSYANLKELCMQESFVSDEEMFFALLTTFHMLGIFSCPDLDDANASKEDLHCSPVFTNPDVLYEQVSTILAVPFRDLEAPNQDLTMQEIFDFQALQKTGIITRESFSLLRIPDTIGSFTNFHSYLLKYLVKWGLAAEMKIEGLDESNPNKQQLFIPSILSPHKGCNFPLPDCPIPQFALTICDEKSKEYYVPQGLFPHFVVNVMNRSDEGYFVPEGVDEFSPRCCDVIAITKRKRKGTEYSYTVCVADNIDHVAVHIKPDRNDENDPRWTENDCYKIMDDLKNSMEEAYIQLYRKEEHSSVILACECSCALAKKEKEETKETHLARLDFDYPEDPVIYCLSRRQGDCEMPCTGTLRDILCISGKEIVQHVPVASSSANDNQEPSLMEFCNKAPSDVGLLEVLSKIGPGDLLAVKLGIPLSHIDSLPNGPLKGLRTLAYWRDGRCDSSLPTTWGFLLEKVEGVSGRNVAEELRETLSKDPACTCAQMNPPPLNAQ